MNFVDIYQKYWKNGYTLTDLSLSGIDREVFRSLFNPVAEVFRNYPAGDVHLYIPGVGQVNGLQPGNYFDSAGTTLASVDGSVGLVLDAAGSVSGDLLTGDGYFNSAGPWGYGTGWSFSGSSATKVAGTQSNLTSRTGVLVSPLNKTYLLECDLTLTAGGVILYAGGYDGTATITTGGKVRQIIKVANALADDRVYVQGNAAFVGSVDNLIVREITGIHATQSTPGYKPTLRKGIVNLLTWSNDLTNAVWATQNSGSATPNSFTFAPNNASQRIQNVSTPSAPVTLAAKVYVASGTKTFRLKVWNGTTDQYSSDLTATTTPQVFVFNATGGSSGAPNIAIANGTIGYAGTLIIEGVGLFQGTLTAADIIKAGIPITTTAPASSQAGVNYLEFDGVDDRLAFSTPLFQMADDHCVVVGALAPANQASYRSIVNLSYGDSANYAAQILIEGGTGKAYVEWKGGGNVDALASPSSVIGTPFVFDVRKVGTTKYAALNGVDLGTRGAVTSATQATLANIGTETNNIPMKGNTYAVLAIKGTVSPTDLLVLRKFVAQLSGVTL